MSAGQAETAAGREPPAVRRQTDGDARLVAALLLLHEQLLQIVDEIQAGDFDRAERSEFSQVLATIAAELVPPTVPVLAIPPWWYRQRDSGGPPM